MKFLKKIKSYLIFSYLLFCSILPFNFLRIFFYNLIPSINIQKSYIGLFNILVISKVNIENSYLGSFNFIKIKNLNIKNSLFKNFNFLNNFKIFYINKKSIVGSFNIFNNNIYKNTLFFSYRSQISNKVFIEMDTNVILKKNIVFGGHGSKIIRNENKRKRTFFNENIFIGSQTIIESGVSIKSINTTIGACSVINYDIQNSGKYFSKKIKLNIQN